MTVSATDRERISAVLEQYRRGFATLNVEDLLAIWDRDYTELVHLALEEAAPRRTWEDIEAYYHGAVSTDPTFRVVGMRVDTLSLGVVGDVAHAFCRFRFEGERAGSASPVLAEGRATFLLRRRSTTWKVIHYHESAPPDVPAEPAGASASGRTSTA